jgi:hypothetical protein
MLVWCNKITQRIKKCKRCHLSADTVLESSFAVADTIGLTKSQSLTDNYNYLDLNIILVFYLGHTFLEQIVANKGRFDSVKSQIIFLWYLSSL